jgi:hypothetical protein
MRPHGHVRISRSKPRAQGVCDRCGLWYTHDEQKFQYDWVGARLQNKYILVCHGCNDKPQENIRTIILPADPMPIANPRAENFPLDDNPISGIGYDPARLFGPLAYGSSGGSPFSDAFSSAFGPRVPTTMFSGMLTGGSGPEGAFFGGVKTLAQSSTLIPSSTQPGANNISIAWSVLPGNPITPSQLSTPTQAYAINQAIVSSPIDSAFLVGSSASTTVYLDGANDGLSWNNLAFANTQGVRGEQVTLTPSNQGFFAYHRVWVQGDGSHQAAISLIQLSTPGPSLAQTGSELGA